VIRKAQVVQVPIPIPKLATQVEVVVGHGEEVLRVVLPKSVVTWRLVGRFRELFLVEGVLLWEGDDV